MKKHTIKLKNIKKNNKSIKKGGMNPGAGAAQVAGPAIRPGLTILKPEYQQILSFGLDKTNLETASRQLKDQFVTLITTINTNLYPGVAFVQDPLLLEYMFCFIDVTLSIEYNLVRNPQATPDTILKAAEAEEEIKAGKGAGGAAAGRGRGRGKKEEGGRVGKKSTVSKAKAKAGAGTVTAGTIKKGGMFSREASENKNIDIVFQQMNKRIIIDEARQSRIEDDELREEDEAESQAAEAAEAAEEAEEAAEAAAEGLEEAAAGGAAAGGAAAGGAAAAAAGAAAAAAGDKAAGELAAAGGAGGAGAAADMGQTAIDVESVSRYLTDPKHRTETMKQLLFVDSQSVLHEICAAHTDGQFIVIELSKELTLISALRTGLHSSHLNLASAESEYYYLSLHKSCFANCLFNLESLKRRDPGERNIIYCAMLGMFAYKYYPDTIFLEAYINGSSHLICFRDDVPSLQLYLIHLACTYQVMSRSVTPILKKSHRTMLAGTPGELNIPKLQSIIRGFVANAIVISGALSSFVVTPVVKHNQDTDQRHFPGGDVTAKRNGGRSFENNRQRILEGHANFPLNNAVFRRLAVGISGASTDARITSSYYGNTLRKLMGVLRYSQDQLEDAKTFYTIFGSNPDFDKRIFELMMCITLSRPIQACIKQHFYPEHEGLLVKLCMTSPTMIQLLEALKPKKHALIRSFLEVLKQPAAAAAVVVQQPAGVDPTDVSITNQQFIDWIDFDRLPYAIGSTEAKIGRVIFDKDLREEVITKCFKIGKRVTELAHIIDAASTSNGYISAKEINSWLQMPEYGIRKLAELTPAQFNRFTKSSPEDQQAFLNS
jgi:hypothetical protein